MFGLVRFAFDEFGDCGRCRHRAFFVHLQLIVVFSIFQRVRDLFVLCFGQKQNRNSVHDRDGGKRGQGDRDVSVRRLLFNFTKQRMK